MQLILEIPEASQVAAMEDEHVVAALTRLGAYEADTIRLNGTRTEGGKRLVLATATAGLAALNAAIADAGLPWRIVAAADTRMAQVMDGDGNLMSVEERYWVQEPDLAALIHYAADVYERDGGGNELPPRRPTVEEIGQHQWHHWEGCPWPALGVS